MSIPAIQLQPTQSAIFGYGSLMSRASLEHTLGRPYPGPFVPCFVEGWRRTWDVAMPNTRFHTGGTGTSLFYPAHILYLNVRPHPDCRLCGVVFVAEANELAAFDRREWIYSREDVTPQLRDGVVEGGPTYLYVGRAEHLLRGVVSPRVAAVRSTYLRILEDALSQLGETFRAAYGRSSDPVPAHLIIDDEELPIRHHAQKHE